MCCAEQPVDEMTCNADNSGCPPRIPSLLCSDHPTAVRVEVEVDNHGKKSKIIKLKLNQTSHKEFDGHTTLIKVVYKKIEIHKIS